MTASALKYRGGAWTACPGCLVAAGGEGGGEVVRAADVGLASFNGTTMRIAAHIGSFRLKFEERPGHLKPEPEARKLKTKTRNPRPEPQNPNLKTRAP